MTGRPRLAELFSLACWEPAEEAEAAAILDTLEAEAAELRRILYAAIDPETGAQTAQDVRDLIQNELNAADSTVTPDRGTGRSDQSGAASVATTPKEVTEPMSVGAMNAVRPTSIAETPGSLTSFGAGDDDPAANERHRLERAAAWEAGATPTPHDPATDDWATVGDLEAVAGDDRYSDEFVGMVARTKLAALARLRARDQARTDALTEAARSYRQKADEWDAMAPGRSRTTAAAMALAAADTLTRIAHGDTT